MHCPIILVSFPSIPKPPSPRQPSSSFFIRAAKQSPNPCILPDSFVHYTPVSAGSSRFSASRLWHLARCQTSSQANVFAPAKHAPAAPELHSLKKGQLTQRSTVLLTSKSQASADLRSALEVFLRRHQRKIAFRVLRAQKHALGGQPCHLSRREV